MKLYPSIPGPSKAPQLPCIAFYKYDGSNIRAGWTRKRGWHKFGTRGQLLDESCPLFGGAVKLFHERLGDRIAKVIRDHKDYRGVQEAVAYCEYFGPSSIGMYHNWDELKTQGELKLFDVNIHKRGFVIPREFVKNFGHLEHVAQVIYEGNFNQQFVKDVREGKYDVREGVVAKGVNPANKGRLEHGLWMVKCKTNWWFAELRRKYEETDNEEYRKQWKQLLAENESEQETQE